MSADQPPSGRDVVPEPEEPGTIPPATESIVAEGGVDITQQSLARPAAVMAIGTSLSRLTGLGRIAAMAYALGVAESRVADSYNLANTMPNVLYELILGGVLSSVFIPVLVQELRTKDRDDAWRSVSSLVTGAMIVLLALTAVVVVTAPWIMDLFTSRVEGAQGAEQQDFATFLLRIFAIQIALYGFVGIAGGLLNSHGRFAVPMFAPIINNLVVIGSFIVIAQIVSGTPQLAGVNDDPWQKWVLALGTTGGVAAMALVFVPFIRQLPGKIRLRVDFSNPAVRKLARLALWTLIYVASNVIGFVVSFYLANQQQGGITAYVTAFAFFQLPIGLAAVPIATALMPKLSAHHVDRSDSQFRLALSGGIRVTFLLMLPATALFLALADPLIQLLLEHGIVGGDSARLVASTLQYFAIGLVPFALYQLFTRAFYARQNTRLPAWINVVENGVSIVLDFILFPIMDVRGLALAHTLGYIVGTLLAAVVLRRELGPFGARQIVTEFGKVLVAAALMCGAMLLVVDGLDDAMSDGDLRATLELAAGGLVGLAVFAALAKLLRIRDIAVFSRLIPGRALPSR